MILPLKPLRLGIHNNLLSFASIVRIWQPSQTNVEIEHALHSACIAPLLLETVVITLRLLCKRTVLRPLDPLERCWLNCSLEWWTSFRCILQAQLIHRCTSCLLPVCRCVSRSTSRWCMYSVALIEKWCSIGSAIENHCLEQRNSLLRIPSFRCFPDPEPPGLEDYSQCSNWCRFHCFYDTSQQFF